MTPDSRRRAEIQFLEAQAFSERGLLRERVYAVAPSRRVYGERPIALSSMTTFTSSGVLLSYDRRIIRRGQILVFVFRELVLRNGRAEHFCRGGRGETTRARVIECRFKSTLLNFSCSPCVYEKRDETRDRNVG